MPLILNVRHLEANPVQFEGELDNAELSMEHLDELMRPSGPLRYAFAAERHERGILLQGHLAWPLAFECARCLRPFNQLLQLDPWVCLLPWEGEDAAVVRNDCVDLTPYLREDILLELPQRPLCSQECGGLIVGSPLSLSSPEAAPNWTGPASLWRELDNLNL
jgi:uncharacterized metal-binding protein YceD (DUF177 family)